MKEVIDLEKTYKDGIVHDLARDLGNMNIMAVPRLTKIMLNSGVGKIGHVRRTHASSKATEQELVNDIMEALALIGGQRPQVIISRRSIAGFKLREGNVAGVTTTLRGQRMYDFLARLIHIALPRMRDFRGIALTSVDRSGNLTIGIRDSSIFPEVPQTAQSFGFEVTLATSTTNREQSLELLKRLGVPFVKS